MSFILPNKKLFNFIVQSYCKSNMAKLFTQKLAVISPALVACIVGSGCRTPEQAKRYVRYDETLNPLCYPRNQEYVNVRGDICNEFDIDDELTQLIGENVYTPQNFLYQIDINERLVLVSIPSGVTENNECIVMVDEYIDKFYRRNIEEEVKVRLLATMAVWKAARGVFIVKKMNKQFYMEFDDSKWEDILHKIQIWSKTALEM